MEKRKIEVVEEVMGSEVDEVEEIQKMGEVGEEKEKYKKNYSSHTYGQ